MALDRSHELIRQAVIRDGHRCSICGRPCGEDEARRHSEPGASGDSAMNFAAMCYACQTFLAAEGVSPARHVPQRDGALRRRRLIRKTVSYAELTLAVVTFIALVIFTGTLIYLTPGIVWIAFGACLLIFVMIVHGAPLLAGFLAYAVLGESFYRNTRQEFGGPEAEEQ